MYVWAWHDCTLPICCFGSEAAQQTWKEKFICLHDVISLPIFILLLFLLFFYIFTVLGFCDTTNTSDVDCGHYIWEETEVGSSAQTPCAFGPSNEQATRECEKRNSWGEPQILACGTQVSLLFSEFNESVVSDYRTRP